MPPINPAASRKRKAGALSTIVVAAVRPVARAVLELAPYIVTRHIVRALRRRRLSGARPLDTEHCCCSLCNKALPYIFLGGFDRLPDPKALVRVPENLGLTINKWVCGCRSCTFCFECCIFSQQKPRNSCPTCGRNVSVFSPQCLFLGDFNDDIVVSIASFLSARDLGRLAMTCRRFGLPSNQLTQANPSNVGWLPIDRTGKMVWVRVSQIDLECMVGRRGNVIFSNAWDVAKSLGVDITLMKKSLQHLIGRGSRSMMEEVAYQEAMHVLENEYDGCFQWKRGVSWMHTHDACERELQMLRDKTALMNELPPQVGICTDALERALEAATKLMGIFANNVEEQINSEEFVARFHPPQLSNDLRLPEGSNLSNEQVKGVKELVARFDTAVNGIAPLEMASQRATEVVLTLAYLRRQEVWGPFIIVAPFSAVERWVQSFAKWAPSIPTVCLSGNSTERERVYSERLNTYNRHDSGSPVVIATYEAAMQDVERLTNYGAFRYLTVEVGKRYSRHICALLSGLSTVRRDHCWLLTDSAFVDPATTWSALLFMYGELLGNNGSMLENPLEVPRAANAKSTAYLAKIWKLLQAP